MTLFTILPAEVSDLLPAIALQRAHQLQFWDALLLIAAARAGCTIFFSEDQQHNRTFDNLTVVNPFLLSAQELDDVLTRSRQNDPA